MPGAIGKAAPRTGRRLPEWFRAPAPGGDGYRILKKLLRRLDLHTVCESARCPNIGECWEARTATFMILGDVCTRSCAFCAIQTGRPGKLDPDEPRRIGEAVEALALRHVVVTSVNRDELPDGGAGVFSETIREIRRRCPQTSVEVLIPDFRGNRAALQAVMDAGPRILSHNLETVPRLYRRLRPQAHYARSLGLLAGAKEMHPDVLTKSGIMVGAGETLEEVRQTIRDIADQGTGILTVGQYLQPSPEHAAVARFYAPGEFLALREFAAAVGFLHVESGPLVRSSYRAAEQAGRAEEAVVCAADGVKGGTRAGPVGPALSQQEGEC